MVDSGILVVCGMVMIPSLAGLLKASKKTKKTAIFFPHNHILLSIWSNHLPNSWNIYINTADKWLICIKSMNITCIVSMLQVSFKQQPCVCFCLFKLTNYYFKITTRKQVNLLLELCGAVTYAAVREVWQNTSESKSSDLETSVGRVIVSQLHTLKGELPLVFEVVVPASDEALCSTAAPWGEEGIDLT